MMHEKKNNRDEEYYYSLLYADTGSGLCIKEELVVSARIAFTEM